MFGRNTLQSVALVGAMSCVPGAAMAFAPVYQPILKNKSLLVGTKVVRPALVADRKLATHLGPQVEVKRDALSGAARVLTGGSFNGVAPVQSADPESYVQAALAYVTAHREVFGVAATDLVPRRQALLVDEQVAFVKFAVYRQGLPVEDASLDFRFEHGKLVQIANQTFAEASVSKKNEQARELDSVVRAQVNAESLKREGDAWRVRVTEHGYVLTRVAVYNGKAATGAFTVEADAADGTIFQATPDAFYFAGEVDASIYPRFYGNQMLDVRMPDVTVRDDSASYTTGSDGTFYASEGSQPGLKGFSGRRVDVTTRSGSLVQVGGQQDYDFWRVSYQPTSDKAKWADTDMAQAMAYYHLNKVIDYAKRYIHPSWFDRPLTANTNLDSECNAYWDGSSVNFFQASKSSRHCANTALIADVMYHEWGHGLHANTSGIHDSAYSEGFGDTVALTMTHSHLIGPGFKTDGSPVRDLKTLKVYPQDEGEAHTEGQIIGGAFYDLYANLYAKYGRATANDLLARFVFKSIYTCSKYTDVYDALLVLDDDDGDVSNGTPHLCEINHAFARHGLATSDERCTYR